MVDVEIEANRKKKKKRNTRRDLNAIHGVSILPIFNSIARIIILKIMFFFLQSALCAAEAKWNGQTAINHHPSWPFHLLLTTVCELPLILLHLSRLFGFSTNWHSNPMTLRSLPSQNATIQTSMQI